MKAASLLPLAGVLCAILAGCAHPPNLSTSLDIRKDSDNLVLLKLKIVNLDDSASVPIAVELTGETRNGGHWDKPASLLKPAAFVLNRKEQREITKLWRVPADAVRTTLVVKEQESGKLLKTEKSEKTFDAAQPTSQP